MCKHICPSVHSPLQQKLHPASGARTCLGAPLTCSGQPDVTGHIILSTGRPRHARRAGLSPGSGRRFALALRFPPPFAARPSPASIPARRGPSAARGLRHPSSWGSSGTQRTYRRCPATAGLRAAPGQGAERGRRERSHCPAAVPGLSALSRPAPASAPARPGHPRWEM